MENKILVETSARHIHLTQESFDFIMGAKAGEHAAPLVVKKELSQPGQFVSDTRLDLIGEVNPKTGKPRIIAGVSILGPLRTYNQVEVSATDARTLGSVAPIRESGDVKGSGAIKLLNPASGKVLELKEGLIVAKRHIHMTPEDAQNFGVKNGDLVKVEIDQPGRSLVFADTVIRVSPNFRLAMHIDTDESNAANAGGLVYGKMVK
jgi:putative phosphotransacetylase